MLKFQWMVAFAALLVCSAASALDRSYPPEAKPCQMQSHKLPYMVAEIDGKSVRLAPGLVVKDEANRGVVLAMTPQTADGMCSWDPSGALIRFWVVKTKTQPAIRTFGSGYEN